MFIKIVNISSVSTVLESSRVLFENDCRKILQSTSKKYFLDFFLPSQNYIKRSNAVAIWGFPSLRFQLTLNKTAFFCIDVSAALLVRSLPSLAKALLLTEQKHPSFHKSPLYSLVFVLYIKETSLCLYVLWTGVIFLRWGRGGQVFIQQRKLCLSACLSNVVCISRHYILSAEVFFFRLLD